MTAMSIFHRPITRKQFAYILGMSESSLARRLKQLRIEVAHHGSLTPLEVLRLLAALGYELNGEVLLRALEIVDPKPVDRH